MDRNYLGGGDEMSDSVERAQVWRELLNRTCYDWSDESVAAYAATIWEEAAQIAASKKYKMMHPEDDHNRLCSEIEAALRARK